MFLYSKSVDTRY